MLSAAQPTCFLIADISGYTGYLADVELDHASDHLCTACPAVAHLDLKVVLHRGQAVRQTVGSGSDLLGPAVTVAHRLLKNTIRDRIGFRPYLFLTDAAATALGLSQLGIAHREEYPDAVRIEGRIVELGEPAPEGAQA
jgi:hypothetical protein